MQNKVEKFIIAATIFMATVAVASASYNSSISTNTCSISVHPYNETGTYVNATQNQWFKIFQQGDGTGVCDNGTHLAYPNQYSPNPPNPNDTVITTANVAGVNNIYAPDTRHYHYFQTASDEDSYLYKTYVDSFQIILKPDALANTDLSKIHCEWYDQNNAYVDTPGCTTNGQALPTWGGTIISFDKTSGTVTWQFARTSPYSGRPRLWGNNPSISTTYGYVNFYVNLTSKTGLTNTMWSASTISRALVRDEAFYKKPGENLLNDAVTNATYCTNDGKPGYVQDYNGKWCTTPAPNQPEVEQTGIVSTDGRQYYWFKIGDVATLWKKYIPPVTPDCTSLNVSPTGPLLETDLPKTINITSQTQGGLNLNYKWTADQNNVLNLGAALYTGNPIYASNPQLQINKYAKLTTPVTVTVTGVDASNHATEFAAKCQQKIVINPVTPPPTPDCLSISGTPTGPFNETDLPKTINITSQTQGGLTLKYKWTADQNNVLNLGAVKYTGSPIYASNPLLQISEAAKLTTPVTVTLTGVDANNTNTEFAAKCQQKFVINPVTPPDCLSISGTPAGPFNETDLPKTIAMTSQTQGGLQVDYKWEADQNNVILLDGFSYDGTAVVDHTPPNLIINKSAKLTTPVTVTVTGVDHNNWNTAFAAKCQQKFVINPVTPATCNSIDISPAGPLTEASMAQGQLFTVIPHVTGNQQLDYKWTLSDPNAYLFNKAAYVSPVYGGPQASLTPKNAQTQDVTLNVIAVDHTDNTKEFAQCAKQVTITKTPVVPPKCTDLQILQQNGQAFPDVFQYDQNNISTKNMTLKVTKDSSLALTYDWNATNGNFENSTNHIVKKTPTDPTSFTVTDKYQDSTVTVYGRFNNDTIMCQDTFKMTGGTPPPAPLKCTSLRIAFGNDAEPIKSTFSYNALSTYKDWYLIPNSDPALKLMYHWTTDNGKLTPPNPPATTAYDTKTPTDIVNLSGADQSKTTTVKATVTQADPSQNVDAASLAACNASFTITPNAVSAKCTALGFSQMKPDTNGNLISSPAPKQIYDTDTIILKTNPNPPDYSLTHWVTHGSLTMTLYNPVDPICSAYPPTKNAAGDYDFTAPAPCMYQLSKATAGATLHVSPASGNGDTTACQADLAVTKRGGGGGGGYCVNDIQPLTQIGNQVCYNVSTTINPALYVWTLRGQQPFSVSSKCVPGNISDVIDVHIFGADIASGGSCQYTPGGTIGGGGGPGMRANPTIIKEVSGTTGVFSHSATTKAINGVVTYRITINPNGNVGQIFDAKIQDTIAGGRIPGMMNGSTTPSGGSLQYVPGSETILGINGACRTVGSQITNAPCYLGNGDISRGPIDFRGLNSPVVITYRAMVAASRISTNSCNDANNPICSETYDNTVGGTWKYSNSPYSNNFIPDKAEVGIYCQYFLTRAAGDIFLESQLNGGIDIRKCSKFKSSTGIIVAPSETPDTHLPSTGAGDTTKIFALTHEVCTSGQAGLLKSNSSTTNPDIGNFYNQQNVSKNLSSEICTVKLNPGQNWQRSVITNSIKENKTRISRWSAIVGAQNISSLTNASTKSVYRIKGDLTIDSTYTLNNGDGAKTFIIEGNLHVNNNIKYNDSGCSKPAGQTCTVRDMPSLAFIVLGGNVIVDPKVQEMDGVYFVQGNGDGKTGNLIATPGSQDQGYGLTINGSVFGNIQDLFSSRGFSGDPSQDQGGIVIRFDERIILNTPPGLSDVIDLTETQVAR